MHIQDLVRASQVVYLDDNSPVLRNWKLLIPIRQTESGYIGAAFQSPNGEIIIAHAGTQIRPGETILDLTADVELSLLQKVPMQWHDAQDFVQEVMLKAGADAQIHHTGHSLGGVLAQLSAYSTGQKAVVFESPGVEDILLQEGIRPPFPEYSGANEILVYNIRGSQISEVGSQITDVQYLDICLPGEKIGFIESHKLDHFDQAFDEQGHLTKTVQNPAHLEKLLREEWEENEVLRRTRLRGDVEEWRLQDQYRSYEEYRQDYISRHASVLKLPYGASASNEKQNQQLYAKVMAKLDRFIQTVQAI